MIDERTTKNRGNGTRSGFVQLDHVGHGAERYGFGIDHTYEEFDDTHSSIDYRMDRSLPFLYRALKP